MLVNPTCDEILVTFDLTLSVNFVIVVVVVVVVERTD